MTTNLAAANRQEEGQKTKKGGHDFLSRPPCMKTRIVDYIG
jgi:hypothetical protein